MTWIMHDEADRRTASPYFRLPSLYKRTVGLDDYRGRDNVVLFFAHAGNCPECRVVLKSFASRLKDYALLDAVVLAIFPEPVEVLKRDAELAELPFPVLSDEGGKVRSLYTSQMAESLVSPEDDVLFVLDQYGATYAALVNPDAENSQPETTLHYDILKWLEYIGMQCPE